MEKFEVLDSILDSGKVEKHEPLIKLSDNTDKREIDPKIIHLSIYWGTGGKKNE